MKCSEVPYLPPTTHTQIHKLRNWLSRIFKIIQAFIKKEKEKNQGQSVKNYQKTPPVSLHDSNAFSPELGDGSFSENYLIT